MKSYIPLYSIAHTTLAPSPMNHTLDQFSDNPIIYELVNWPPRPQSVSSVRASSPLFRNPFVEIALDDNEMITRTYSKDGFTEYWTEARVILETLTSIKLISDVKVSEAMDIEALTARILEERDESIAEASLMFDSGMYQQFLWQFGRDYKGLPDQVVEKIAVARAQLKGE